ncbi:hypothetical protein [Dongia rigui]|uniref:Uncharacterized protein n=1 Tax=Dongia rigui TaxID=940149 RepID=A0ABU5DT67_9PROT|nr:hypothetical protein [Dongia rigui]MDY0870548.1 hypothetical protein [Dongia rigui]
MVDYVGAGTKAANAEAAALIAKNAAILAQARKDTAKAIEDSNVKPAPNAADDLAAINEQVKVLVDQKEIDDSGRKQEYQKNTNDVQIDNNMTARDIGILRKNDSRLNLFSSLTEGDKVDVFKFRVTTTANTKLGTLAADEQSKELLRVQVFSKSSGALIADQDPKSGDAYENFKALQAGTFELDKGDYLVRVSRLPGLDVRSEKAVQYVIQLSQGVYRNDFDTVEKGVSEDQDAFGQPLSLGAGHDALMSGLSSASSFISSLPAIGTSATDKLTGAMYDALS